MWQTFRLGDGTIEMATKVWSDFGATIPLERSFAYGSNFPPEYPLFAGPPIRYHFVFFMIVGLLERFGIPLDWALNSLSILGFFGLLSLIYLLATKVFESKVVGALSVILFLFNGSWGFLEFFQKHPLSASTFSDIVTNTTFSSFGPYDGKIVSAFWSLNIFTNQRHLAVGYACFLGLLYVLYTANKKVPRVARIPQVSPASEPETHGTRDTLGTRGTVFIGILIGLFPFIHLTVYMMMCILLLVGLLTFSNIRKQIIIIGIIAGLIGIPQIFLMGQSAREVQLFNPGYLVEKPLTLWKFIEYWLLNLGLASVLVCIGFLLAKKRQRKVLLPFIVFFIIGNLFQFSPEMASNHKFFNMFVIGANMFAAYALYHLWKKHILGKVVFPFLFFTLILTGIIDMFPIFNDGMIVINDIHKNETATFIKNNTPSDAVFLNAMFLFDPASLAGRKIYLGWPYFSWSAGYDTDTRFRTMKLILGGNDKRTICTMLYEEGITYIEIKDPSPIENVIINYQFFEHNFVRVYKDLRENLVLYDVKRTCH